MFPSLPHVLEQKIVSMVEMLPGIPDTPNNKKMLLSVLKCPGGRGNSFARKDLGVGNKFCYVRVDTSFTEKRDRAGTKTKTYRFVVSLKVEEAPNPPLRTSAQ